MEQMPTLPQSSLTLIHGHMIESQETEHGPLSFILRCWRA